MLAPVSSLLCKKRRISEQVSESLCESNFLHLNVMIRIGLHLVLSYYALADRENMRKSFMRLLDVNLETDDLDRLFPNEVESHLIE